MGKVSYFGGICFDLFFFLDLRRFERRRGRGSQVFSPSHASQHVGIQTSEEKKIF